MSGFLTLGLKLGKLGVVLSEVSKLSGLSKLSILNIGLLNCYIVFN